MKSELEALVEKMIAGGILFEEAVKEFEKHFILRVITRHRNNLSKAAEELGIHRNTLTKRLQGYTPQPPVEDADSAKFRHPSTRRRTRIQSLSK